MGFGEYLHWPYGKALMGKPNYVSYVGLGSGGRGESQESCQERMLSSEWPSLRKLANENLIEIEEPKASISNRNLDAGIDARNDQYQGSFLYRMGEGPRALEEKKLID